MAAVDSEQLRLSGFKRILVRLDENTRRKYCCRAVEEDLKHAKEQLLSCMAAMTEVKQVQDATLKLDATQRAAVSRELLTNLETLRTQLETSVTKLCKSPTRSVKKDSDRREVKKEKEATMSKLQEVKVLSRELLSTQNVETAVNGIRQMERLMPEVDEEKTRWKKYVVKVVTHVLELVKGGTNEHRVMLRLKKTITKMVDKCPDLETWHSTVQKQLTATINEAAVPTTHCKKKRAIPLPDDGETALIATTSSSTLPKAAKASQNTPTPSRPSLEKTDLHLCSREVRALRDKFDLGAYDVNLSRMVTIVDSLWTTLEQSHVELLTTALFTLVETVEKVENVAKRRDRLMCLESVLGVVLSSSKLQLTPRRKTMIEEYANNCRQSLEQLTSQAPSNSQLQPMETSPAFPCASGTKKPKEKNTGGVKSHVRFNN